jgi:hypothetical protein
MDTPQHIRRLIAFLIAPLLVAALMIATESFYEHLSSLLVLLTYILAHVIFWPSYLVARFAARRLNARTLPKLAALVGAATLALTSVFAAIPFLISNPAYGWHAAVRDELSLSVAAAASVFLYAAFGVPGVMPNIRWSGP